MQASPQGEVTRLLAEAQNGDHEAEALLAELVYDQLRKIAHYQMRGERPDHTLEPTILVHETYVKLVRENDRSWQNRTQFYAVASHVMRNLLVDYARARTADKRGGIRSKVELDEMMGFSEQKCDELLALDEALNRLATLDARQSRVVELRFFGGLNEEDIAELLNVSVRTVKRDWKVAKGWLHSELTP